MGESLSQKQLLDVLRWHIVRADNQRNGLWARAAAILSANAVVIAGAAIVASSAGEESLSGILSVAVPLIASMFSVYKAANVVGAVRRWPMIFQGGFTEVGLLYSLPGTVAATSTYDEFRAAIATRSEADELEGAILELWRISVLHMQRMHALRLSVYAFVLSIPLFIFSSGYVFLSTAGR
jgi:hypothetical protein